MVLVMSTTILDSLVTRVGGFNDLLAYAAECAAKEAEEASVTSTTEVLSDTVAPLSGATVRA
jgi:hypothetical protein